MPMIFFCAKYVHVILVFNPAFLLFLHSYIFVRDFTNEIYCSFRVCHYYIQFLLFIKLKISIDCHLWGPCTQFSFQDILLL